MILRRVIEHVRKQEWTAIAIDFVIVVVGVFIGIQVANWNQQHAIDRQAEIFTERLRADLRVEAWNYDYMIQYFADVQANAERTLAVLEGRGQATNEQLLISAYRATQYNTHIRRRATYDEMTATGNINLIKDGALREAATLVYDVGLFQVLDNQSLGSRYREAFRMQISEAAQSALGARCGDRFVPIGNYRQIVGSLNYDCTTGLSQDVIDQAADILRSNDAFIPMLRLRVTDMKTVAASLQINNQDTRKALKVAAGKKP